MKTTPEVPMTPQPQTPLPWHQGVRYPRLRDAVEGYFTQFDAPRIGERKGNILQGDWECSCGKPLGGFLGTFEWGLAHGEGFCANCRRPARAFHRIIDPRDGSEIATLGPVTLLYRAALSTPREPNNG